uniref:EGF_CA domain-containing protein n=1 Tax=Globodera pallida TaxID=36090 RepID=A0A183CHM1_GLOPA
MTCTKVGALRTLSLIHWLCVHIKDVPACMENTKKNLEDNFNMTGIECKCDYGEEGKNLTNVQYELPIVKPLQCKKGQFDSDGLGGTLVGECKDEDHFCFMASCAKGNEHVKQEWDCSGDRNCSAISERVGKAANSSVSCKCLFGKADVDMGNENFTREMMTTTTTAKPTKTTKKRTTTTTDKPTPTTTAKTLAPATTTTAKSLATMGKSTTPSKGPTANTTEANRDARHSVAIFCKMLMAIGILASSNSMLIGHRFNAA